MPAKNAVKLYIENGFYHAYNRGVEKRDIFLDARDYAMFLYFLKYYLTYPDKSDIKQQKRSLKDELNLCAFCLMPNHFHLLLKQFTRNGMTKFVRAVCTSYVGYFNNRYKRVGTLFQGKYRAAIVDEESYLLHLSRYIHTNPRELMRVGPWSGSDPLQLYPYSSYAYYLGAKSADWLNTTEILGYFNQADGTLKKNSTYLDFVEGESLYPEDFANLLLE